MKLIVKRLLSLLGVLEYIQYKKESATIPENAHILIHIGKCGGQTVRDGFMNYSNSVDLKVVHVAKPIYRQDLKYFVVARGPISRLLSAFRWRYKLVITDGVQSNRFKGEREVLLKYKTLNNLAEDLYYEDGSANRSAHEDIRKIHHIKEDIAYYLHDLLQKCRSDQIIGVLMQENLNNDIYRLFGYENKFNTHFNPKSKEEKELSDLAISNLKHFFYKDYVSLTKLHCWGKIEQEIFINAISDF